MALEDELSAAAGAAAAFLDPGEELAGILAAEPSPALRVYVCAFSRGEQRSWLVLDASGAPIADRALVREAVSIIGLCELAEETAGGGDLPELRARLAQLAADEHPQGIERAEDAAAEVEATIAAPPRVASLGYLDALGAAVLKLEGALGEIGSSPFAQAMQAGAGAVEELARDVESGYKRPLG
jgi:hypothetical protein